MVSGGVLTRIASVSRVQTLVASATGAQTRVYRMPEIVEVKSLEFLLTLN